MAVLAGIDVSNNNGRIDWAQAAPHVAFVYAKASQGTTFRDAWYFYNRDSCREHGIPFGAYHWLEPAEAYGQPEEVRTQIERFHAIVGTVGGDLLPALDIETTSPGGGRRTGEPSPNDTAYAVTCVEELFGVTPLLYGGQPVLLPAARRRREIVRCRLWKAIYPRDKASGFGVIDPWDELTMWQWTSKGSIPGVTSAGLDMNDLYVPVEAITVGASPSPPIPQEAVVGLCIPAWSKPADPAGVNYPCYSWDGRYMRAWFGAPIAGDWGQQPNAFGLPCVEIDAQGWLAGHAKAEGPEMSPDGSKVCIYRDDGAPLVYPTGQTNPATASVPPPPVDVDALGKAIAPNLAVQYRETAG